MPVNARVIVISAIASGQGETSVTAALARKLVQSGKRVAVFKIGADFIDPQWLASASAQPVDNLDLWLLGKMECLRRLQLAASSHDYVLIEGVMGLYDGVPSSADLARELALPVVIVLDVAAMAQTAAAILLGLRDYGPVHLAGLIANKVASPGHAEWIAQACQEVPLLASLPRQTASLPERHLGLCLPEEDGCLPEPIQALAETLTLYPAFYNVFGQLPPWSAQVEAVAAPSLPRLLHGKTIAIARDAAFCFIYPANLALLEQLGASLVFFSPLANQTIPEAADALYLPGGYPELYAATLSAATIYHQSVRQAHQHGMPIWAECGGMISLSTSLLDLQGDRYAFSGVFAAEVQMQSRITGLGLQAWDSPWGEIRGHSFHFSSLQTNQTALAYCRTQPKSSRPGEAIYQNGNCRLSYFHAYFPSNPVASAALFLSS